MITTILLWMSYCVAPRPVACVGRAEGDMVVISCKITPNGIGNTRLAAR